MTPKPSKVADVAARNGCTPKWYDGIFGWQWHCGCPNDGGVDHRGDQQCSVITTDSAKRKRRK